MIYSQLVFVKGKYQTALKLREIGLEIKPDSKQVLLFTQQT